MDIQVGDRVTYIYLEDNKEVTTIVCHKAEVKELRNMQEAGHLHQIKILEIERPKYEVIEEKKELLTEEEREFLKCYIKIMNIQNTIDYIEKDGSCIYVYEKDGNFYRADIEDDTFNDLIEDKEYTISELGIE